MTIMMSDSLKDIVSIGQLTGETANLLITIENDTIDLDVHSFLRTETLTEVLAFSSRETIARVLQSNSVKGTITFDNLTVQVGPVVAVGYKPISINNDIHDMLSVHIKRDN